MLFMVWGFGESRGTALAKKRRKIHSGLLATLLILKNSTHIPAGHPGRSYVNQSGSLLCLYQQFLTVCSRKMLNYEDTAAPKPMFWLLQQVYHISDIRRCCGPSSQPIICLHLLLCLCLAAVFSYFWRPSSPDQLQTSLTCNVEGSPLRMFRLCFQLQTAATWPQPASFQLELFIIRRYISWFCMGIQGLGLNLVLNDEIFYNEAQWLVFSLFCAGTAVMGKRRRRVTFSHKNHNCSLMVSLWIFP